MQGIPLSSASIKADINDLMKLLPGASYKERSGQATVKAERKGDTIFITAVCDSLRAEIVHLEAMLSRKTEVENKEVRKNERPILNLFKWCIISAIVGFFLLPLYKLLIRIEK